MTGERLYRRTQIAWPTIVPLGVTAAIILWTFSRAQFPVGLAVTLGMLLVTLTLFATLTVTVTSDELRASFGVGAIRKRVRFSDVASFVRVRNSWTTGWGIRAYPGGTLYNASGLSAVEFKLTDGRYVAIGTDDPDGLVSAVQQATQKVEGAHEPTSGRPWGVAQTIAAISGVAALVLAGALFYFGFQPPSVRMTDDAFAVSNGLYRDRIQYSSITSATLEPAIPPIGLRTNGFAAGNTLRGSFIVHDWGHGRLYINRDRPPFVVIRTGDGFVAVNFTDPARTRAVYQELTTHINRSRG